MHFEYEVFMQFGSLLDGSYEATHSVPTRLYN